MKIIIVGGVAAGMSAATRLRRLNEHAQITVYEMGEHVSYANCGLPYYLSETIAQRDDLLLQTPHSLFDRFRINVRVRHQVLSIEPAQKSVRVRDLTTGADFDDNYDKLVLATGASPRMPEIEGIERALSLRDVTDVDRLKIELQESAAQSVAIIGGGFVGVELAENLHLAGFSVTLIQRGNTLLSNFDPEMVEPLQQALEARGITIALGAHIERITKNTVELQGGTSIAAAVVIAAAGVNPDNALARAAGLRMGETGGLWVDETQRTSDANIYAAGDAVEKHGKLIPLANLANRHGRLIADAISGLPVKTAENFGTIIVGAFGMALAMTGLSERMANALGIQFEAIHLHPSSHASYYPGAKRVSLKVLFDPQTGKLLGAQATGEDGADKRIDVLATAMFAGLSINDLMDLELAYSPQYGSAKDAINHAGYVGNNVFSGRTPLVQWHELPQTLQAGATLVDVRTKREYDAGHIEGSINIPVDELRDHIESLAGKKVLVHCQVGQRGHTATQILRGNGIEAANLDGGYVTWRLGNDAINRTRK